jgi:hypothetical protein
MRRSTLISVSLSPSIAVLVAGVSISAHYIDTTVIACAPSLGGMLVTAPLASSAFGETLFD